MEHVHTKSNSYALTRVTDQIIFMSLSGVCLECTLRIQPLITRFATGGHDIFLTCPAKSMHLEPFGLSVHAFGWTGQENIIPTCRSAGNYYILLKGRSVTEQEHCHTKFCESIEFNICPFNK